MDRFVRQVNSQKWRGRRQNEDSFVMTIMDMDVPLFPAFRQAILNKLSLTNNFTYKDPSQQYYKSIIDWYRLRHLKDVRTQIKNEHIVISPSVLSIIYLMIQNETKETDGILMLTPIFSFYKQQVLQLKRTVVESRLRNERNGNISRYEINYPDLQEKAKKCKLMIFCNPQNPTGRIWTEVQVSRIVNICKQNGVLLISDEIMSDLVSQSNLSSFYSLVNSEYPRLVIANSISKSFNSSSIKGGYAFIKDISLRKRYLQITDTLNLHANQFALYCTEIFYSLEGVEWLKFVEKLIRQNYNYLSSKMKDSLLVLSQLQAGYAICIGFEGYLTFIEKWYRNTNNKNTQQRNMVDLFLREHKIAGNLMPYLGQHTDILTDVRFTIAVEQSYFRRFADTLIASLLEVQGQYGQLDSKL